MQSRLVLFNTCRVCSESASLQEGIINQSQSCLEPKVTASWLRRLYLGTVYLAIAARTCLLLDLHTVIEVLLSKSASVLACDREHTGEHGQC